MSDQVAPGVYALEHQVVEGKNGVVVGSRRALAIDSGSSDEEGRALAAFVAARGRSPDRLVLTHGHGDHVLGSGAFGAGEVFAHALTPSVIRRTLAERRRRAPTGAPMADEAAIAWPTVTFADEIVIDLGGKTVRLFAAPGHSEDLTCAYVVEDRVLFGSDAAVTGIVPAIYTGTAAQAEASLRRLADLEVAVLVPGHGPVLRGVESTREWLTWLVAYVAGLRRFVRRELGRGRARAEVVDAATYEAFVGDRLPPARHGMLDRHRQTVLKIVDEEGDAPGGPAS